MNTKLWPKLLDHYNPNQIPCNIGVQLQYCMELMFSSQAWDGYLYRQKKDKTILKRINKLIKEIKPIPYKGVGKPERLRHGLSGYWSRRINDEHRIIYTVKENSLLIVQIRYHYEP